MGILPAIGTGGSLLMKLLGPAALGSTALLGGYEVSKIPGRVREDILRAGPNDPDNKGAFKVNPIQDLMVDPEELRTAYFSRQRDRLAEDRQIRERLNTLGLTKEAIGERSGLEFLVDTKKQAADIKKVEELEELILGKPGGADALAQLDTPSKNQLRALSQRLDEQNPFSAIGQQKYARKQDSLQHARLLDADRRAAQGQANELAVALAKLSGDKDKNMLDYRLGNQQLQIDRRRLEMEDRRADRRLQQEMILRLVDGLRQTGQAFSY